MLKLFIGLVVLFWHSLPLHGIQFQVKPRTIKCIMEEVPPTEDITIQYAAIAVPNQTVDLILRNEDGETLEKRRSITNGKYTFENHTAYMKYEICYEVIVSGPEQGVVQNVFLTSMKAVKEPIYSPSHLSELSELELLANSTISDYILFLKKQEIYLKKKESEIAVDTMFLYCALCIRYLQLTLASIQVLFLCLYIRVKLSKIQKNRVQISQEVTQNNASEEVS